MKNVCLCSFDSKFKSMLVIVHKEVDFISLDDTARVLCDKDTDSFQVKHCA